MKSRLEIPHPAAHFIAACARGGMADAPDLGSGPARVGGSSPLARTNDFLSFMAVAGAFLVCYSNKAR